MVEQFVTENPAKIVADIVVKSINAFTEPRRFNLGLFTGGTSIPVYEELLRREAAGEVSFSNVTTWNLDEYVGLPEDHPEVYRVFMTRNFFHPSTTLNTAHTHFPADETYDDQISAAGGVDLWLIGIGNNGHIAFNEPGTPATSKTHIVELTPSTREANARFFNSIDEVPTHAVTSGIATIMGARKVVLVANGAAKAAAIKGALAGAANVPASALRDHENTVFVLDSAAAGLA